MGVGLVGVGLVIVAGGSVDARSSALAILVLAAVLTALGAVLQDRLPMATYAYVTPVVAVALGWAILDETISLPIALGALLVIGSVAATPADDRIH